MSIAQQIVNNKIENLFYDNQQLSQEKVNILKMKINKVNDIVPIFKIVGNQNLDYQSCIQLFQKIIQERYTSIRKRQQLLQQNANNDQPQIQRELQNNKKVQEQLKNVQKQIINCEEEQEKIRISTQYNSNKLVQLENQLTKLKISKIKRKYQREICQSQFKFALKQNQNSMISYNQEYYSLINFFRQKIVFQRKRIQDNVQKILKIKQQNHQLQAIIDQCILRINNMQQGQKQKQEIIKNITKQKQQIQVIENNINQIVQKQFSNQLSCILKNVIPIQQKYKRIIEGVFPLLKDLIQQPQTVNQIIQIIQTIDKQEQDQQLQGE